MFQDEVNLECRDPGGMAIGDVGGSTAPEVVVGALSANDEGENLWVLGIDEPGVITIKQVLGLEILPGLPHRIVGLALGDINGDEIRDRLFIGTATGRLQVHSVVNGLVQVTPLAVYDDGFLLTGDRNTIWFVPATPSAGVSQNLVVYTTSGGILARPVP
jgi:hypothetical protein